MVPGPSFKIRAPISCLDPRLLHTSNIVFKNVPPVVFATLLRNPGDGPDLTIPMSMLQQSGHFRAFTAEGLLNKVCLG